MKARVSSVARHRYAFTPIALGGAPLATGVLCRPSPPPQAASPDRPRTAAPITTARAADPIWKGIISSLQWFDGLRRLFVSARTPRAASIASVILRQIGNRVADRPQTRGQSARFRGAKGRGLDL